MLRWLQSEETETWLCYNSWCDLTDACSSLRSTLFDDGPEIFLSPAVKYGPPGLDLSCPIALTIAHCGEVTAGNWTVRLKRQMQDNKWEVRGSFWTLALVRFLSWHQHRMLMSGDTPLSVANGISMCSGKLLKCLPCSEVMWTQSWFQGCQLRFSLLYGNPVFQALPHVIIRSWSNTFSQCFFCHSTSSRSDSLQCHLVLSSLPIILFISLTHLMLPMQRPLVSGRWGGFLNR